MKRFLSILIFSLVAFNIAVYTQVQGNNLRNNGGKIEALKIAFLTNKMALTPTEAQQFWPIYNKYTEDVRKTRLDAREKQQSELDTEEKVLSIRKKYENEFGKVLSNEKVNAFFKAEKEFGTYLQKEIMERRQNRLQRRNN